MALFIAEYEYSATELGKGSYSTVYQGSWFIRVYHPFFNSFIGRRTATLEPVAMKVMALSAETIHVFQVCAMLIMLALLLTFTQSEAKIHRIAGNHPNIVSLLDCCQIKVFSLIADSFPMLIHNAEHWVHDV